MKDYEKKALEVFENTKLWRQYHTVVPVEFFLKGLENSIEREFIEWAYAFAGELYAKMPDRKNGEPAFVHPTNVARYLKIANAPVWIQVAGLLHDWIEENFDIDIEMMGIEGEEEEERYLVEVYKRFQTHVMDAAKKIGFPLQEAEMIHRVVWVLSRHKRHNYYKSIEQIFSGRDKRIKNAAAQVKLSDRMHNIQTLENYEEDEQIYQCFKNIYILNRTKALLRSEDVLEKDRLLKLFKKSGKATFEALMKINHRIDSNDQIFPLITYLYLALKKYVLEIKGLWQATPFTLKPGEPTYSIYHGILEKYDLRLKHKDEAFIKRLAEEIRFLMLTFKPLNLPPHLFREAIFYKDSMALLEVIASLLYLDDYIIGGFDSSLVDD